MKFGLRYCDTARYIDPKEAVALAQAALANWAPESPIGAV
jgi:hypothetical protein